MENTPKGYVDAHKRGISIVRYEFVNERIGVFHGPDSNVTFFTFQNNTHHVFLLTDEQAAHIAALLNSNPQPGREAEE